VKAAQPSILQLNIPFSSMVDMLLETSKYVGDSSLYYKDAFFEEMESQWEFYWKLLEKIIKLSKTSDIVSFIHETCFKSPFQCGFGAALPNGSQCQFF